MPDAEPPPIQNLKVSATLPATTLVLVLSAGFSAPYWTNFVWHYLDIKWGENAQRNLIFNAGFGLFYTIGCLVTRHLSRTLTRRFMLMVGFGTLIFLTTYSTFATSAVQIGAVILAHAFIITFTWPNLESLMAEGADDNVLSRRVALYNVSWAGMSWVAYAVMGRFYEWNPLTFFVIPILGWFIALGLVIGTIEPPSKKGNRSQIFKPAEPALTPESATTTNHSTPEAHPDFEQFRTMSRIGNMAGYVLVSTLIPMMPVTTSRLGFGLAGATAFGSLWFFTRVAAFIILGTWKGWRYRAGIFHLCMVSLPVFFAAISLSDSWIAVGAAQIALGFSLSLIYTSSLFYSLHGKGETSEAAVHEAVIGLGIMLGPLLAAAGGEIALWLNWEPIPMITLTVVGLLFAIWFKIISVARKAALAV